MWHFRRARTALLARFKGIVLSLTSSSLLGFLVPFVPNAPRSTVYALPYHPPDPACATDGLPLPPPALWLGYAATAEYYVRSGAAHMEQLLELAREAGWTPQGRVAHPGLRLRRWAHDPRTPLLRRNLRDLGRRCPRRPYRMVR